MGVNRQQRSYRFKGFMENMKSAAECGQRIASETVKEKMERARELMIEDPNCTENEVEEVTSALVNLRRAGEETVEIYEEVGHLWADYKDNNMHVSKEDFQELKKIAEEDERIEELDQKVDSEIRGLIKEKLKGYPEVREMLNYVLKKERNMTDDLKTADEFLKKILQSEIQDGQGGRRAGT